MSITVSGEDNTYTGVTYGANTGTLYEFTTPGSAGSIEITGSLTSSDGKFWLIGGGGGGGNFNISNGGGGGGGEVINGPDLSTLSAGTYSINVAGTANSGAIGNSTIISVTSTPYITAYGGGFGSDGDSTYNGCNSAGPGSTALGGTYPGGIGGAGSLGLYGGGGGAGGDSLLSSLDGGGGGSANTAGDASGNIRPGVGIVLTGDGLPETFTVGYTFGDGGAAGQMAGAPNTGIGSGGNGGNSVSAATQGQSGAVYIFVAAQLPSAPPSPEASATDTVITAIGYPTGVTGGPFTSAEFKLYNSTNSTVLASVSGTFSSGGLGGDTYTATFTGLTPSTTYNVTWYLQNGSGNGVESDPTQTITSASGGGGGGKGGNPTCFLRGSKILCLKDGKEEYVSIENMRVGTEVKTLNGTYVKVHTIGKTFFNNPDNADRGPNRLFRLTPSNYPELTEDLIVTGCHSILVDKLEPKQKARHLQLMKTLYMTTGKFRLMAFIDEKAEPYQNPGSHEIWHFALENEEVVCNYGVYANGGLLVETASIKNMRERSGLVPIE